MTKKTIAAWNLLDKNRDRLLVAIIILTLGGLFLAFLLFGQSLSPKPPQSSGTSQTDLPPLPISITSPKEGETVSKLVPVVITNPSGRIYDKLEFWVDKQLEKRVDAVSASVGDKLYEVNYKLDTTKYADGSHVLTVMIVDMKGIYQSIGVKINFANKTALKAQ